MPWVALALGVLQTATGAVKKGQANREAQEALKKRKPYQTPIEVFKQLQARESKLNVGFDPTTFEYLKSSNSQGFSDAIGSATALNADPNVLGAIFRQKMDVDRRIGSDNAALQLENFGKYMLSLDQVGKSKDAEWASKEGMVKEAQQAAQKKIEESSRQISNGLNLSLSAISAIYNSWGNKGGGGDGATGGDSGDGAGSNDSGGDSAA